MKRMFNTYKGNTYVGLIALGLLTAGGVSSIPLASAGSTGPMISQQRAPLPAPGKALSRVLEDVDGNRFRVTVTPPAGRTVDPRLLSELRLDDMGVTDEDSGVTTPSNNDGSRMDKGSPIDVTGFHFNLESLEKESATSATCSSCTRTIKLYSSNQTLGAGGYVWYTYNYPEFTSVAAYPTSGNVDVEIFAGGSRCASSSLGAGHLDFASCIVASCANTGTTYSAYVRNQTSSTATWQGVFTFVFIG